MTVLEVFDPAMCCSTGVCGPAPDPVLPAFAADLDWIGEHGVEVRRFNLSQEPGEFVQRPTVQHLLTRDGDDALPIVMLGDSVLSSGRYPSRDELASWVGVAEAATVGSPIGAAAEADAGESCCGGAAEPVVVSASSTTEEADSCCGGNAEPVTEAGEPSVSRGSSGCCG